MVVRVLSGKLRAGRHAFGLGRISGLAIFTALVAAAVAYMQVTLPIAGPDLTHADAVHYWRVAVIALVAVLVAAAAVAWLSLRARRR